MLTDIYKIFTPPISNPELDTYLGMVIITNVQKYLSFSKYIFQICQKLICVFFSNLQDRSSKKSFARNYINEIAKEVVFNDRKKNELLKLWPSIFHEMVHVAVMDMSDLQGYMKQCLEYLDKDKG